jgi:hypothetical protein
MENTNMLIIMISRESYSKGKEMAEKVAQSPGAVTGKFCLRFWQFKGAFEVHRQ